MSTSICKHANTHEHTPSPPKTFPLTYTKAGMQNPDFWNVSMLFTGFSVGLLLSLSFRHLVCFLLLSNRAHILTQLPCSGFYGWKALCSLQAVVCKSICLQWAGGVSTEQVRNYLAFSFHVHVFYCKCICLYTIHIMFPFVFVQETPRCSTTLRHCCSYMKYEMNVKHPGEVWRGRGLGVGISSTFLFICSFFNCLSLITYTREEHLNLHHPLVNI